MAEARPILWTGPALADLREIKVWVERDSPDTARRLAAKIRERVNDLAHFPSSGRVVPEIGIDRYREVIVRPYRVIYEIRENDLVILRVRHSRRDLPEE
jgi:plasmid stabilization system protein ParE